ncbi:MAG: dihydrofolate synthase/folylpolyglutamate synthase [Oceanicoccus sp.]|jgi:dihydrofolate synthase/folylpolyglutamate synthase
MQVQVLYYTFMKKASEIIETIAGFPRFPSEERLSRVSAYLEKLGNPHLNLKFVHVTGTNGKGSTCSMLASVLQKSGFKVGLFTSPHIFDWQERVQINGENIRNDQIESHGVPILDFEVGVFEAWFLLAMSVFAAEKVDIVVLEAGIGGRLDTTNVIPSPEVSVITNVGLEHTEVLGDSLEKIALDKAGIVKGSTLVTGIENSEVLAVLPKHRVVHCEGGFQEKNKALAKEVIQVLRERGWEINESSIEEGLHAAALPIRMEVLNEEPFVLADGAHNLDGVRAMKAELPFATKGHRYLLMGVSADKDYEKMVPLLADGMDTVVISEASFHAASAEELAEFVPGAVVVPDLKEACSWVMNRIKKADQLYILGSLYFAADAVSELSKSSFLQ